MEKTCPQCRARFTCTSDRPGCWCEELSLTGEQLARIALAANGCLCRTCLASAGQ